MAKKKRGLNEDRYFTGITAINRHFPDHAEQGMLAALGNIENWKGGFDIGRTWQSGQYALVIAMAAGGKRCIKVMGKVPHGMTLGIGGLKAIYEQWLKTGRPTEPLSLTDDQMNAIIFAAALVDGDDATHYVCDAKVS